MSNKKTFTTPRGVAVFPRLNTPDTKFDAAGVYKTDLALSDSEPSTQKFKDFIQKRYDAYVAKLTEENNGKAPRMNDVPFQPQLDKETGEPTGNTLFRFSSKASGTSRKTGKPWSRTIPLFDAKGKETNVDVWGGSEIKVSFTVGEYKAGANYGIKCYLEAVQIIELVSGGTKSASGFGFSEEEGFEGTGGDEGDFEADDSDAGDTDGADF